MPHAARAGPECQGRQRSLQVISAGRHLTSYLFRLPPELADTCKAAVRSSCRPASVPARCSSPTRLPARRAGGCGPAPTCSVHCLAAARGRCARRRAPRQLAAPARRRARSGPCGVSALSTQHAPTCSWTAGLSPNRCSAPTSWPGGRHLQSRRPPVLRRNRALPLRRTCLRRALPRARCRQCQHAPDAARPRGPAWARVLWRGFDALPPALRRPAHAPRRP